MTDAPTRITVHLPGGSLELRHAAGQRVEILTAGQQGPTGTLAAETLAQIEQAITDADAAAAQAQEAVESVNTLIGELTTSFTHYGGAITAQETR
ncbi:MAG: hypothetical protein ACQEXI_00335 [Pseudomonadota bacterium]